MSSSRSDSTYPFVQLAFVGDSDISRWPEELLPVVPADYNSHFDPSVHLSGHSGATLDQVVPYAKILVDEITGKSPNNDNNHGKNDTKKRLLLMVACAGENDIGHGLTMNETMNSFQSFLNSYFGEVSSRSESPSWTKKLIFLGPKLEPWLADDPSSRKQYLKLSKAFRRACEKHESANNIIFLDCITMFCGDSANVPGALFGGKATADPKYFSDDQLHLNSEGYQVWQQKLGSIIYEEINGV
mmetsp:Transcript_14766/g.23092  ORF Transcript_14766/g.23092 Transcript_14766/m.23092 type:complete len:243 (+) Transcript_14766:97-825(+)